MGVAEQLMRRRRDSGWGDGPACASLQLHSPGDGAGSAPAGSSDGGGTSSSPGLAVFFSSHVGDESQEHPSSWEWDTWLWRHPILTEHSSPGQTHLVL